MYCKNCGEKLPNDSKFCGNCGKDINDTPPQQVHIDPSQKLKSFQLGTEKSLQGLGGWLILVFLGMLYSLVTVTVSAYTDISYFLNGTVERVSSIQGYAGALAFELFANIIFVIAIIYLLFSFYKKKKTFPRFYIYFLLAVMVYAFIDVTMINSLAYPTDEIRQSLQSIIDGGYQTLVRAIVSGVIWISYMKKSKRVKLTFIE